MQNYKTLSRNCGRGQGQESSIARESLLILAAQLKTLGSQENMALHKASVPHTGKARVKNQTVLAPNLTIFLPPAFRTGGNPRVSQKVKVISS